MKDDKKDDKLVDIIPRQGSLRIFWIGSDPVDEPARGGSRSTHHINAA
jgi:hypothetical protein